MNQKLYPSKEDSKDNDLVYMTRKEYLFLKAQAKFIWPEKQQYGMKAEIKDNKCYFEDGRVFDLRQSMNWEEFKKSFESSNDDESIAKIIKETCVDFPFGPIPHWIKCSDRMPVEGQTVICYNGTTCTGYHHSKIKWHLDLIDEYEIKLFKNLAVTHWMPLPEPPND